MSNETILIEQLKNVQTKEKAFRELITLYKERLYWHIRKIVISHDDADDVLQNTFIKIFKNIDKFNQESKLFSWMYRIATNESITFINKRAKQRNVDITDYQQELASTLASDIFLQVMKFKLFYKKQLLLYPKNNNWFLT